MAAFGFNFRQTKAYVTDPAGTECISTSPTTRYPTTRTIDAVNYSVGYVDGIGSPYLNNATIESASRNRSLSVDARLSGSFRCVNDSKTRIRITLPQTGDYDVNLALGDATNSTVQTVRVYDQSTLLATIVTGVTITAGQFIDANGVTHTSSANWVANNTVRRFTFATTEARIEIGDGAGSVANSSTINHCNFLYVAPSQTVTSINGGSPIPAGKTGVASVTTGFTGLPTTITTNASGVTCSSIGGTTNAPTFTLSDRVDGGLYPKSGTSVNFTFTNGSETAVGAQTVVKKATETVVLISSPLFVANTLAQAILTQAGLTVATGYQFYHTTYSDLVIGSDTDFTVTDAGSFDLWLYVNAGADAGKNYYFAVTIAESGDVVVTGGGGLTSTGLTSSGLTLPGLTSSGL